MQHAVRSIALRFVVPGGLKMTTGFDDGAVEILDGALEVVRRNISRCQTFAQVVSLALALSLSAGARASYVAAFS